MTIHGWQTFALCQMRSCFVSAACSSPKAVWSFSVSSKRPGFHARSVLLTEARLEGLRDYLAAVRDNLPIYLTSPRLLQQIAGHNFHRGCLAIGERTAPLVQ